MAQVVRYNHDTDDQSNQKMIQSDRVSFTKNDDEESKDEKEDDIKCGVYCCTPNWLQVFASKKSFALAYTLVLTMLYMINAYFMGTITTVEKNYKMSSKMLGSIKGTAEIGSLFFNFILTYFVGKGHKGRWLAVGMIIAGCSSFLRTLPYISYGAGENLKIYTDDYKSNNTAGYTNITDEPCDEYFKDNMARNFAFKIFLVAQLTIEIAGILLKTSGSVYLDNNTRKNIFPFLYTLIHAIRLIGVFMGFMLASYTLEIYIDPYSTPNIDKKDPRWVGAWWLGWIPISILCFILTLFLCLFPRTLPRAALRNNELKIKEVEASPSVQDFLASTKRILKNKLVLLDAFSAVCFKIGLAAYEIFLPKYIESQFALSASQSNFMAGFVALIGKSFGILIVGFVMTYFKPSPRLLMGCNVIVGIFSVLVHSSYIFIDCSDIQINGHRNPDHSWNVTDQCNINNKCENIKYSPVCHPDDNRLFFSACHAGCQAPSFFNNSKVYNHCSCVPDSHSLIDGVCAMDCSSYVISFLILLAIFRLIRTSIKSIKKILRFRYVSEADKSLSLGINKALLSILAAFPSPILYGFIIDWTCIIFEETCGKTGNCWLYDVDKLRYTLNLVACGFLTLGTVLDGFLWYHVKHLKIYDQDIENEKIPQTEPENNPMLKH
ncbi:solute carrier organic anion transporter family member 74D-like isoform X2 [Planococcus citri]|uniref:solute carrier organic anion transporter family member 74D-like isoform X2 n=1 Tax=Planococcus citri TaxID=170843 RepID=UPI0031FA317E